jgi:hypothetical protein
MYLANSQDLIRVPDLGVGALRSSNEIAHITESGPAKGKSNEALDPALLLRLSTASGFDRCILHRVIVGILNKRRLGRSGFWWPDVSLGTPRNQLARSQNAYSCSAQRKNR